KEFGEIRVTKKTDASSSATNTGQLFFEDFLKIAEEKQLDSQITRIYISLKEREVGCLSIHQLLIEFKSTGQQSAQDFFAFASTRLTSRLCSLAECSTRDQSDSLLWHELRYGRITASKILEAAHCKTSDGTLMRQIIGAADTFSTIHMKRGKILEEKVLAEVEKKMKLKCKRSGLILLPSFPILGASPDAVGDDFIIEIKCPAKENTVQNYVANGQIKAKC
ncbi:PREDICTED: uncharacterized protein LOC105557244, partial [Vollenhovia emeryi]|uniref:uncharacterized protein LOC105557244 n=1 Tax=Vollenhovia emeryi TaxID=411798 RepID=UPI0005F54BF2